jgi:two-component system sensor histidine kinase AlgZ
MAATHTEVDPAPPASTRPGGLWASPSRPVDAASTGFGPTIFAPIGAEPERAAATPASVFDVCHAGVVLRALLFVHVAMAIGVAFNARNLAGWVALAATGSSIALPAVLAWLLVACGLKRPLGALPLPGQWVAAVGLGALAAGIAADVVRSLPFNVAVDGPATWLAPALAGAALAAALFQWLHLRAKATLPAETTARLAELQSRIRPHFLFNTLNTALALVRLDPARAEGVLEDLAELFRVALSDGAESVTLGEEVELARRYLAIEEIRFGERLKVQWELDPAASGARVPPLLLQPLVENAVRHGVEPSAEGGVVRIRTRVRHGRAVVAIANSVPSAPSRKGHGMALKNVRERLRLMHDVAAQFDTQVTADTFRVQIVVPI